MISISNGVEHRAAEHVNSAVGTFVVDRSCKFVGDASEKSALPFVSVDDVAKSSLAHVSDRHCTTPVSAAAPDRWVESTRFVFPRSGAFAFHSGATSLVVDTSTVLMFAANEQFRVTHPIDGGDDTTVLCFSPSLMENLFTAGGEDLTQQRFAKSTPEMALLLRGFYNMRNDPLAVDELAVQMLASLRQAFGLEEQAQSTRARARAHKSELEAIDAIRSFIAANPDCGDNLEAFAKMVYMSPFHLARRFRALTGSSVHQYRLSQRFSLALEHIGSGCDNLSGLAQCLGFVSHSHLSAGFKRQYGVSPSEVRRCLNLNDLPALHKLLRAVRHRAA